jgi:hypothetical protein
VLESSYFGEYPSVVGKDWMGWKHHHFFFLRNAHDFEISLSEWNARSDGAFNGTSS